MTATLLLCLALWDLQRAELQDRLHAQRARQQQEEVDREQDERIDRLEYGREREREPVWDDDD